MKDRNCFDCGGKHLARDCPNKTNKGPMKAIEDAMQPFFMLDHPKPAPRRPQPRGLTMADFPPKFVPTKVKNRFGALDQEANNDTTTTTNTNDTTTTTTTTTPVSDSRVAPPPQSASDGVAMTTRRTAKAQARKAAFQDETLMDKLIEENKNTTRATSSSSGVCRAIGVCTDEGCRPKPKKVEDNDDDDEEEGESTIDMSQYFKGKPIPPVPQEEDLEGMPSCIGDRHDLSSVFPAFGSQTLQDVIRKELESMNEIIRKEEDDERKVVPVNDEQIGKVLNTLCYNNDKGTILSTDELIIRVRAAMDSGAVDHVINPEDLPPDVVPAGAADDEHYVGANNSKIKRFGEATTSCAHKNGTFGIRWNCAAVTRPLNSVSKIAGPAGPVGKQDVLFNNNSCYVVQPGVVNAIMKVIKAVAEYPREGNLYLADLALTSFAGQGSGAR